MLISKVDCVYLGEQKIDFGGYESRFHKFSMLTDHLSSGDVFLVDYYSSEKVFEKDSIEKGQLLTLDLRLVRSKSAIPVLSVLRAV